MAKGRRIGLRGGLEQDALTGWRKHYLYTQRAGVVRYAKRKFNRRARREASKHIAEW